ncbi:hypothetical protein [Desulfobacula toluolica]|uniref:Flagellar protein FliT n=1 Tax=Desulfobacula toluolica (strain DSM 7467 / Tol2) TaxID=651182 RepID=K0NBJ8_DESTT|nr:hypothetical protein [Desulfobacula toluolica]CCK81704.1 uncharacterized protein TOL2_C35470 [Desulfobacula toluolica Tol2]
MEKKFKSVEATLNRLHDLQAKHLASFDSQDLPDLEQQSAERDAEVAQLIRNVNTLIEQLYITTEVETKSRFLFFNDLITGLLEQNKAIETKTHAIKNKLENSMKQLSKGKCAISSYRSSAAVNYKPKVISITN